MLGDPLPERLDVHRAAHTDSRFGTYAAKLDLDFEEEHS